MIRARIKALVRSWTSDNGDEPDTDYQDGYMAACAEHARELGQLLAEEEVGWRPIAEMPADGSVWRLRLDGEEGFVRAERSRWTDRVSYRVVTISSHGGWTLSLGGWSTSGALVAPLPEPPPGARP